MCIRDRKTYKVQIHFKLHEYRISSDRSRVSNTNRGLSRPRSIKVMRSRSYEHNWIHGRCWSAFDQKSILFCINLLYIDSSYRNEKHWSVSTHIPVHTSDVWRMSRFAGRSIVRSDDVWEICVTRAEWTAQSASAVIFRIIQWNGSKVRPFRRCAWDHNQNWYKRQ